MYNHNNVVRKQASKQANDFKLVHQMWNVCSVMVCIHRSICRGRRPWVGWGRGRTGWGRDGGTARRRACRPHSPSPLGRDDEERERVSEWVRWWRECGGEREREWMGGGWVDDCGKSASWFCLVETESKQRIIPTSHSRSRRPSVDLLCRESVQKSERNTFSEWVCRANQRDSDETKQKVISESDACCYGEQSAKRHHGHHTETDGVRHTLQKEGVDDCGWINKLNFKKIQKKKGKQIIIGQA